MSEATPEDLLEQAATPSRDVAPAAEPVVPLEAPVADVQEQAAVADEPSAGHRVDRELPLEADAADAAEQASVVELDEDERR